MFIAAAYVFDRLSGPGARADEIRDVRRRLVEQDGPGVAGVDEKKIALELRRLREELGARVGLVEACASCARPRSERWPGGACCSGHTRDLFTDDELAALRLSGTTPSRLRAPRTPHAGCAFRGARGCSLAVAHRPCQCVRYMCRELGRELDRRGDDRGSARLQEELRVGFERFVELQDERAALGAFRLPTLPETRY
jgi:hypothetical protein